MDIKEILFKEACERVEPDIKETLFKEACTRIESFNIQPLVKEVEAKEAILYDGLIHVAFLDKESMGAYGGSNRYRAALNLTIEEFPIEDHSRLQKIKQEITENFAAILIQKVKTSSGIVMVDLQKDLGVDPNYLRLVFKKHLLPTESEEEILDDLAQKAEGLDKLTKLLDQAGCPALPFYSKKCVEGGPGKQQQNTFYPSMKASAESINSQLMTSQGHKDFLKQNPALKAYWQRFEYELSKTPGSFPPVFQRLASGSIKYPASRVWEVNNRDELLWAVHDMEVNGYKSMHSYNTDAQKDKKDAWKKFVVNYFKPKIDAEEKEINKAILIKKQQSIIDKVWNVFGIIPIYKRNLANFIKEQTKRSYPKDIPLYSQFTQEELKLLITFWKAPALRFRAQPIKRPNGFDMPHIYPPILFSGNKISGNGKFVLDPEQGNMGLKFMAAHCDILAGPASILNKYTSQIEYIYDQLTQNVPDHPIMRSHTSSDNLLFFLQELQQGQIPKDFVKNNSDYVSGIKAHHGSEANTMLAFIGNLIGKIKGGDIHTNILQYGPALYKAVTHIGSNGVCLGYQLGKILDMLDYTILKYLPEEEFKIYKVKDRNYSHAGVSGQIFVGVRGAYRLDTKDIAAGKSENIELLNVTKPTGAEYGMISKTHLPTPGETSLPQMEPSPVYNEWGKAQIASKAEYVLTQSSAALEKGQALRTLGKYDTLEEALSALQSAYPEAQRFIEERLNIIGMRLDLATKNIHAAVLKAIELKKSLVEQAVGGKIIDESGKEVTNAVNAKEQEIVALEGQVEQEEAQFKSEEVKEDTEIQPVTQNQQKSPQNPSDMASAVIHNNEVAQEVVDWAMNNGYQNFVLKCYKEGPQGNDLEATKEDFDYEWKHQYGNYPSIEDFINAVMNGWTEGPPGNQEVEDPSNSPHEASIVSRLVKVADKFDKKGYMKTANKVDLLIVKLKEE